MSTFIAILIFIDCLLLIGVILIQESKGGGLASSFSSSNQLMGVKKTADFLEKATWTLVGVLFTLCILSAAFNTPIEKEGKSSEIKDFVQEGAFTPPAGFQQPAEPAEEAPAQ